MSAKKAKSIEALHSGATRALKRAVAKALVQHELAGVPAAIWKDGKVVYLSGRRKNSLMVFIMKAAP